MISIRTTKPYTPKQLVGIEKRYNLMEGYLHALADCDGVRRKAVKVVGVTPALRSEWAQRYNLNDDELRDLIAKGDEQGVALYMRGVREYFAQLRKELRETAKSCWWNRPRISSTKKVAAKRRKVHSCGECARFGTFLCAGVHLGSLFPCGDFTPKRTAKK